MLRLPLGKIAFADSANAGGKTDRRAHKTIRIARIATLQRERSEDLIELVYHSRVSCSLTGRVSCLSKVC